MSVKPKACFEISWEVANAVGGIHTVVASKAEQMRKFYDDHYFVMGPWLREHASQQEKVWEEKNLTPPAMRALEALAAQGVAVKVGRWKVPGYPFGLLIDFSKLWPVKDRLLSEYWERFGLDSLRGGRDYEEPFLFGVAAAYAVECLARDWLLPGGYDVLLHAHEWLTGSSILRVKHACPEIACTFTTHATALGRSLASRAHLPETPLGSREAQKLALECGVSAKHSLECVAARVADIFSTVSATTATECERILGVRPHAVLPNALAEDYPSRNLRSAGAKKRARKALFEIASRVTGGTYSNSGDGEPILVVTSGRYEFRNKGLDILSEALGVVQSSLGGGRTPKILALYLVPADSDRSPAFRERETRRLSHALRHPDNDPLLDSFEHSGLNNDLHSAVHVVWVPKFLDGSDETVPLTYFELLAGADLTVFPSWYEPWGYTPMESVALGIPSVTSDLTGFSNWAADFGNEKATGVFCVRRKNRTHRESVMELAEILFSAVRHGRSWLAGFEGAAGLIADQGAWGKQITAYVDAHELALKRLEAKRQELSQPKTVDSAYFSMEFAVIPDLHIYSGGLGVLAGDFLKAARDLGHHVVGVGLAYREGYFRQKISEDLRQEVLPAEHASFEKNGLRHITDPSGLPLLFDVPLPDGKKILSGAWNLEMGSAQLLLLDTDVEANPPELRSLGRRLYTADRRERWLQEYFLGVGGIRLLEILGIRPKWLHLNEGHTALLAFERAVQLVRDRYLSFDEAMIDLRKNTLFTTHTPVPAGHEEFEREICRPEIELIASRLRVRPGRVFERGRGHHVGDPGENSRFSLTALALRICSRVNAVSKRHRIAAERSFSGLALDEKHLFSITNGVHPQTWISPEWQALLSRELGPRWTSALNDMETWKKIALLDDETLWECHLQAKRALCDGIRDKTAKFGVAKTRDKSVHRALARLQEESLIAVFARRFTAYKRPELLFLDASRLSALLKRFPDTLFIFAGKAHPADGQGQELIHQILKMENSEEFSGHVLFLENYGVSDAQLLVAGADLWINFPQQPLEASGTSGMKAGMNGVLNLSVNDGWVPEADSDEVPWKIGLGTETLSRPEMDWIHAQELYACLEEEVFPEYWDRNAAGIPVKWVSRMKRAIAATIPNFSAQRMVREYADRMEWWLKG